MASIVSLTASPTTLCPGEESTIMAVTEPADEKVEKWLKGTTPFPNDNADQNVFTFRASEAQFQPEEESRHGVHLRLSFPGANPQLALEPFHPLPTTLSYFRGADPAGWPANVPVWGGVRYANLYPNIDLELSDAGGLNLVCHIACATANVVSSKFD